MGLGGFLQILLILAVIVVLIFFKGTRKVVLKISLGLLISAAVVAVFILIGMRFFRDNTAIFTVLSCFTSFMGVMFGISLKELVRIVQIKRNGCITAGEIFDIGYGRGSGYKIRYRVNNQEYTFTASTLSQGEKLKVGDSVTVIYSPENPQKSYMKKNDSVAAIALVIGSALLLIGAIAVECYVLTAA